ncbi:MAG: tRNA 4-thiouridine(8) synthase ThiI [Succinivibrio sp.]|nr:tRNA 4-thiouridine(8) synthase ThiI [Succinivibrio sp.]
MKFVIRLFPEISIKSRPVRNRLIKMVSRNFQNVAQQHGLDVTTVAQWDKVIVDFKQDGPELRTKAVQELSRLPGVHSFMEVREFNFSSLDDLFLQIKDLCGPLIVDKTFAVRVKRRGQHEYNSQQAERVLGGKFKAEFPNRGVDLTNPEVTIHVSIENDLAYVEGERYLGLGGYPVGSQGEVYSLISGGFDSGVSSFKAIHRGCRVNYLFFNMGGTAHEIGVKQESYYLWDRYASSHKVRFITVPFEDMVGQILERTHHGVRGVILKRMMVRVASALCRKYHAEGMVTGESLGQVSSQTITNLSHIDRVTDMLIIRPLITADKQEIIDESRRIGTLGFAENMPEYCGVISDHPNVCPSTDFVEEQEAKIDADLVDKIVELAKVMDIRDIPEQTQTLMTEVEIIGQVQKGEVVLDVRAPDDQEKAPLSLEGVQIIALPFYKVVKEFVKLDPLKTYALYCDQGVMSTMAARQLKEQGHHNVKVLRPEV